ncbi:MAG: polyprenyl synthetase family protein [Pseudomonadota bacterium]
MSESSEDYRQQFSAICSLVDQRLAEVAPAIQPGQAKRVRESVRYSLLDGGKRLRPLVTVLTAEALGADPTLAIDVACAIEMVHTASLIIDDLPCMDDAASRRGKPANHRAHGEDIAILGAISLVSEAFGLIARSNLPERVRLELTQAFSVAIGVDGLCTGQERDLRDTEAGGESLDQLQYQKTGSLFALCLESGARVAGLTGDDIEPLRQFGEHAGLGFQIFDDLLDVLSSEQATGKDHAQDRDKPTAASTLGTEGARRRADEELKAAIAALDTARLDTRPFSAFLDFVLMAFDHQVNGATQSRTL